MDPYAFNWLNNDDSIIDSLVSIAALPDEPIVNQNQQVRDNVGANIIDYLLYNNETTTNQQQSMSAKEKELKQAINDTRDNPELPFNVIEKDNFVTFTPLSNAVPKKPASSNKKSKSRGPIFVTTSPQTFSKKLRKYPGNPQSNSSDENSENDMNENSNNNASSQMTSKEERLHRNKISARNFRVRRKEYIKQLQDQVKDQAQTIQKLQQENEELRKSNEELMKHVLFQPITPSSTSNHKPLSTMNPTSSSSGSEGNYSPDAPPAPASMFDNLYDFNLFENLQLLQPQQPATFNIQAPDLFYLNHATIPDWDISKVLSEKGEIIATEEEQQRISKDLLTNYPLLAPALMSIILRHTLSMEIVASLAKDLKKEIHENYEDTLPTEEEMERIKARINRLKIKDSEKEKEEDMDELTMLHNCLSNHYSHYALHRAIGNSHEEAFRKFKECQIAEREKAKNGDNNKGKSLQNIQLYSRVAGDLLRYPQRMSRMRHVLKSRPEFKSPLRKSTTKNGNLIDQVEERPVASTSG